MDTIIHSRRSYLSFDEKPVEERKLLSIFEAARWAPSSFNAQPWRYIYTLKNQVGYNEMYSLLFEGNKTWALTAPVLILSIAEMVDVAKNRANKYAFHDTGMANIILMLQAVSLGLVTHPMGGFDVNLAKELFKLPSNFEPVAIIALGYPGESVALPEDLQKRQNAVRNRKEIKDFAFNGIWE